MKIEILKDNLKTGISIVEKLTGKNLSLPILNNVLLISKNSFLNIVATDLETAIKLWVLTKVVKEGSFSVPAKIMSTLINTLPNDKITIDVLGESMSVSCGKFKNQIQGTDSGEFPIIPKFDEDNFLEVDSVAFCTGLSQVVGVASYSQARPEISGIYFSFFKNTITMVATDSFRLAEKKIKTEFPIKNDFSFILPQKPAAEIINILSGKEGKIKIYFSQNQVMFEFPMEEINHPYVQIISRIIDGEYPNYEEIIPQKFKTEITVKRDEFLNQIKTASIFSGKTSEIKLKIKPTENEIVVESKDPGIGENNSSISAKIKGDPVEISFNYKFLFEGILNIKGSEVVLEISKEDGPCVVRSVGDASYIYVAMPIKPN